MPDVRSRLRAADGPLGEATRLFAKAEGLRDALALRCAELGREVGLAKGRLALRPRVDEFLERLQEDWTRNNVDKYEKLLNALHGEVFADQADENRRIVFDLSMERGMPALDVLVECNGARDEREDVLEDNGGALTNVVGAALRIIAVVKSHTGKFLVLDEPDCWTDMARVAAFYRVLTSVSARLGIQCLVITHKDVRSLGNPGIGTARHVGWPKTPRGNDVVPDGPAATWPDGHRGFRSIRLVNVQGYVDVTIPLAPGILAITGPNGRGKSTITRAWRAVFYGEGSARLIRHRTSVATIEVGLHDGRVLRYSRARKRNPVNMWSLLEADGSVVEEDGTRFETGGSLPEWVSKRFRMGLVDGLDVHISHQKKPVFLLGEPASRRASVLSIGQESSYIQDMQAIHKERCSRDQALVREGEKEIGQLRVTLASFSALPDVAERLRAARAMAVAAERVEAGIDAMERHSERLSSSTTALGMATGSRTAFDGLPSTADIHAVEAALRACEREGRAYERLQAAERALEFAATTARAYAPLPVREPVPETTDRADVALAAILSSTRARDVALAKSGAYGLLADREPVLVSTERMLGIGTATRRAQDLHERVRALGAAYGAMTPPPALEPTDPVEARLAAIVAADASREQASARLASTSREIAQVRAQVDEVLADSGGTCMTCGQPVDDFMKLLEHAHP